MGIDVNLYVTGFVTDPELDAAVRFFKERELRGIPERSRWRDDTIDIDMNGARFWGPGYERGPWLEIHACILATVAAFPGHSVYYGGDSDGDMSPIVDQDMLDEYWAHWLSPHWNDYRLPCAI